MKMQQELYEAMSLLNQAGWSPRVCDTMIHVSACPVCCGQPALPGDDSSDDSLLLPSSLVGMQPEIFVPARGDSMVEAGIDEGDLLRVRINDAPRDGDIVVAMIDGAATVKALFTDEQSRRWLVPRNEHYDAIPLPPEGNVRMIGTVVGIEKRMLRASSADCMKSIRRTLARQQEQRPLPEAVVDAALRAVASEVVNSRQWYAVYRALADAHATAEGCYSIFCQRVASVVPTHSHLPIAKEIGRMAVQSFRKRVTLWRADDAPVRGQCFCGYLRIAQLTAKLLK